MVKKRFPICCTLAWRANGFVSRQGRGVNRTNESTILIIINVVLNNFFVNQLTVTVCTLILQLKENLQLLHSKLHLKKKEYFSLFNC